MIWISNSCLLSSLVLNELYSLRKDISILNISVFIISLFMSSPINMLDSFSYKQCIGLVSSHNCINSVCQCLYCLFSLANIYVLNTVHFSIIHSNYFCAEIFERNIMSDHNTSNSLFHVEIHKDLHHNIAVTSVEISSRFVEK